MFRGYLFGRLRHGRTFRQAVGLSMLPFIVKVIVFDDAAAFWFPLVWMAASALLPLVLLVHRPAQEPG